MKIQYRNPFKIHNSQKGVSLVELMVSLSIMAIIASIASPSMATWMNNMKIKSSTESIFSGINSARAEAIKINAPVTFVLNDNGTWDVVLDSTNNTIYSSGESGSSETVVNNPTPSDASRITFNSMGVITNNSDSSPTITSISIENAESKNGVYASNVNINSGGSISYCSYSPSSYNPC